MKIASTAAEAAVDAPKMSRNSRSHPIWYDQRATSRAEQHSGGAPEPSAICHAYWLFSEFSAQILQPLPMRARADMCDREAARRI